MVCFVYKLAKCLWGERGGKYLHPLPICRLRSPPHTNLGQVAMLRVDTTATDGKLQQCGY